MAEIDAVLEKFMSDIKATSVYQEYEKQKERMKTFPDIKEKIDVYRRRNSELQQMTPSERLFDELDSFQKEYEDFLEIPLVEDFLSAELAYCRMVQRINECLYREFAIDFE